jgi:hypothetical protein
LEIENIIDLPQSDQREKGVKSILEAGNSDTVWAVKTILHGLEIEENYLSNSAKLEEGYVWISWENIKNYIHDFALLGMYSPNLLNDLIIDLSPSQKNWTTIALGYRQDNIVHKELINIMTHSDNILQKAMAIEAISQYQDTSDINLIVDVFKEDGNTIDWKGDGTSSVIGFSPVGQEALIAFKKYGYKYDPISGDLVQLKKNEEK